MGGTVHGDEQHSPPKTASKLPYVGHLRYCTYSIFELLIPIHLHLPTSCLFIKHFSRQQTI